MGFFLLCAFAGLLLTPCLIPCFIRLIANVVVGMQMVRVPVNPNLAAARGRIGTQKIMVLRRRDQKRPEEDLHLILHKLEQSYGPQQEAKTLNFGISLAQHKHEFAK